MTIPTDLGGVTVADDFFVQTGGASGSALAPLGGTVTFSPSYVLTHVGDGPTILPEDIPATVDPTTGHLEQFLLVSNDPDWNEANPYTVTYNLTDPSNRGRPVKAQPVSFQLVLDAALIGSTIRLRTQQSYGQAFLTRVDNGDGTESLTGAGVLDNGDGTFTFSGPTVLDNGDGTYTYQAG